MSSHADLPSKADLPSREAPSRARILVIDDEPQLRNALRRMLREHDVDVFGDAREALERITRDGARYDVVLCDLAMPKMSGLAFFEALAAAAPRLRDRFVFLTGGSSADTLERIEALGVDVIEKPFDIDDVRRVIAAHAPV